jgi:hypothetical protein
MKYPTVSALCEGVAGAIREKEGSTEKINPQDFVQRIENLQVGGGTSESNIEYLDVSGVSGLDRIDIGMYSLALKGLVQGMQMAGIPTNAYFTAQGKAEDMTACMIDFSLEVKRVVDGSIVTMTIGELFKQNGIDFDSLPRITKEQFYTLE